MVSARNGDALTKSLPSESCHRRLENLIPGEIIIILIPVIPLSISHLWI